MFTKKEILNQYLKFLEIANYEEIMSLFAADAVVNSPLYGRVKASNFYKDLLADTSSSKLTLKNIFEGYQDTAAMYFEYVWTMKDGQIIKFEVMDVFDFDINNKIKNLTIIYDTHLIRPDFQKYRSSFTTN